MDNTGVLGISLLSNKLAEIFTEDSEYDRTFYGFSDSESDLCDKSSDSGNPVDLKGSPIKQPVPYRFTLRVVLRPRKLATTIPHSSEEEEEERKIKAEKKETVRFEVEEKPVKQQSDSDDLAQSGGSFLAKRAQNITANKAMLAQLIADLHKMPGAALLKSHKEGNLKKEKGSRAPRSKGAVGMSRTNPTRSSRRQTRSMGGAESLEAHQEERELELSLEEELLEVRGDPRRRSAPRPKQANPHNIRPVEEITEDVLLLVADHTTEKVYNRATGSTCHQCRQKTTDTKTCCRSEECRGIVGQFCGPCLRNRYGEDVRKALLDPDWRCPPCRGICNCSFCRARDGRCPTGILFPLAQYHGFSDVHSYLSRSALPRTLTPSGSGS
ncbi:cell division cycle-associated protein 7 isoform X1 [Salmo salar]|uniref:Cell division cycle-associated protein 7 isoform X1 n=1 Tax=Salmo salar TaxID=8030 RepID=A0A1S3LEY7_SALSA|nr:cell division cycle-associated protein 7 isoform X1 [Salmo salar]|eukprot:XP_013989522.1 PREDICTED: cell division cycle-associated protein 7-like isoform X1 [Salmo salar]